MLLIKENIPTKNLPIKRVLSKLFQSYIYTALDDKEHEGYKHPNGKVSPTNILFSIFNKMVLL